MISGGYNVYPKEERLTGRDARGSESAVIMPHPDFGEAVVAVVVPAETEPGEARCWRRWRGGWRV
ncbi:MAG: hypothetical protein R3E86_20840 [Pseudomonadales bacterium]